MKIILACVMNINFQADNFDRCSISKVYIAKRFKNVDSPNLQPQGYSHFEMTCLK